MSNKVLLAFVFKAIYHHWHIPVHFFSFCKIHFVMEKCYTEKKYTWSTQYIGSRWSGKVWA